MMAVSSLMSLEVTSQGKVGSKWMVDKWVTVCLLSKFLEEK